MMKSPNLLKDRFTWAVPSGIIVKRSWLTIFGKDNKDLQHANFITIMALYTYHLAH